jgi:hypothetical protein
MSAQTANNSKSVVTCACCQQFVGPVQSQVELGGGHRTRRQVLASLKKDAAASSDPAVFLCACGCGELYCSERCRADAHRRWHRLLCPKSSAMVRECDTLAEFTRFALRTSETLLFGAKVIAQIVCRAQELGEAAAAAAASGESAPGPGDLGDRPDVAAALLPFQRLFLLGDGDERKHWWDVLAPLAPAGTGGGSTTPETPERERLQEQCQEGWGMLRAGLLFGFGLKVCGTHLERDPARWSARSVP